MPFGPFNVVEALLPAKLVASREGRRLLTHCEPDIGEHLERGDVKRIALECAADGDAVTQMTSGLLLRVEEEHLPGGIVIQRQVLRPAHPSRCTWPPRRRLRPRCNCC